MADWKSALAALGAAEPAAEKETPAKAGKRVGVVYSTNPDYEYDEERKTKNGRRTEPETETLPCGQQKLRLSMERAGRGGKTVTLVRGFVGTEADLAALCKLLKQKCGVGGSAKEGEIIIQGDHRQRLLDILRQEGYSQTK